MQQIASDLRRRASSSGELGAIGRSRSGTAFPSPYAQAAVRPPPVRPPRRGRQLCDRCRRQRPGDRIRCVRCQRRVGPGCTPGCLLVELRGTARERVGLCADWPHCRSPGVEVSWVQAVTEALFPLYPDDGWRSQISSRIAERMRRGGRPGGGRRSTSPRRGLGLWVWRAWRERWCREQSLPCTDPAGQRFEPSRSGDEGPLVCPVIDGVDDSD